MNSNPKNSKPLSQGVPYRCSNHHPFHFPFILITAQDIQLVLQLAPFYPLPCTRHEFQHAASTKKKSSRNQNNPLLENTDSPSYVCRWFYIPKPLFNFREVKILYIDDNNKVYAILSNFLLTHFLFTSVHRQNFCNMNQSGSLLVF